MFKNIPKLRISQWCKQVDRIQARRGDATNMPSLRRIREEGLPRGVEYGNMEMHEPEMRFK